MSLRKSPVWTGLFLFSFLCLQVACTESGSRVSTKPVVQVNQHQLLAKEFSQRLARRLKDLDALTAKDPTTVQNAKDEIIRQFVVRSLLMDWGLAHDIKVPDAALDKEVERLRANYPDDLSFRRSLAEESLSFSEWREELRHSMIERAVFSKLAEKIKSPSDDEISKYFADNRDRFKKKERVFIRQIVVDEESKAEMLKAEVKGHDFATLAKKYSIAPEAEQGGSVGWIEKGSVDFFDPVFSQAIGAVSPVIHSPFGYHLVKVEKKLPASNGTLDDARPQIARQIRGSREQAEFVSWLDAQIRSSRVLKDDQLIKAITVETRSVQ